MKNYDLIIIGAGGGLKLRPATALGKKVAVIEKAELGGTCLNHGCIPSKMLIHAADVAEEIRNASRYNLKVDAEVQVNFEQLIERVNGFVSSESDKIAEAYSENENVDLYRGHGKFVDDKVIEVNGEKITAEKIFIATGSRARIPSIEGLADTPYITSKEALKLKKQPRKMIIIGGGYIGLELGHFYGALGTETHFLVRDRILSHEDADVVEEFTKEFTNRHNIHHGFHTKKVEYADGEFTVHAEKLDGEKLTLKSDSLFVATGIIPNSDELGLENTSIKTDDSGYIKVNDHLETQVPGVYALGDVIGHYFFRHSVNFQAEYLFDTLYAHTLNEPIKYSPMPYAVFTNPQIAGVGKSECELDREGIEHVVGLNYYKNSAMGDALRSENGFVKIMFDLKTQKILGARIVGPEASDMIHMLIAYMNMDASLDDLLRTIYIHPALPENIRNAARNAKKVFDTKK